MLPAAATSASLMQLGGASVQLARALSPFISTCLRRAFSSSACRATQPALAAEEASQGNQGRFSPVAPSRPSTAAVLQSTHSTQRFSTILAHYRSAYPEAVWAKLASLTPRKSQRPPVAIDIAVGSEGRAGVELAKRGFEVLCVGSDSEVLSRTLICAQAKGAALQLLSAAAAPRLVGDASADLVTCMHGLHLLVDPEAALREVHRILRPGGRLVVAFNDRDLGHSFVAMMEDTLEAHVPGYSRASCQHSPDTWAPALSASGLFRLVEFNTHANPVVLRNLATLSDMLNAQPYVRGALTGPARKALNSDVRSLVELFFGDGPLLLPLQTKLFILEKAQAQCPPSLQ